MILVRKMAPQQRVVQLSLRNVTPSISEQEEECAQLEEDLKKMKSVGLLERPWGLKNENVMRELIAMERPNMFEGTIQDCKFAHMVDPKDGHPVRDCRDTQKWRLLEFIVPIIHPDKPTRVMITIGNTIFGALDRGRPID